MACLNLSGYAKGCDDSIGGIKKVVIVETGEIDDYSISEAGQLTGITLGTEGTAHSYDYLRDNSNFTDGIIGDGLTSSVSWQPSLNMIFRKNSLTLVQEIFELSRNYVTVFVEDNNGEFWVLGLERGLMTAASPGSSSGNLFEDPNNLTVLLQGKERHPMYNMDVSSTGIDSKILAEFGL